MLNWFLISRLMSVKASRSLARSALDLKKRPPVDSENFLSTPKSESALDFEIGKMSGSLENGPDKTISWRGWILFGIIV